VYRRVVYRLVAIRLESAYNNPPCYNRVSLHPYNRKRPKTGGEPTFLGPNAALYLLNQERREKRPPTLIALHRIERFPDPGRPHNPNPTMVA